MDRYLKVRLGGENSIIYLTILRETKLYYILKSYPKLSITPIFELKIPNSKDPDLVRIKKDIRVVQVNGMEVLGVVNKLPSNIEDYQVM